MPDTTTAALILRAVDLRESDRLVTLLTRDLGKVSAVARGARSSRKRFGGALEPFALIEVVLGRGRGRDALFTLGEATLIDANARLAGDLERFGAAAFALELAREVTPEHEPDPRLFDLLVETLGLLSGSPPGATRAIAAAAALKILSGAGLGVGAGACTVCGRPVPEGRRAHFDPRRGGVVCTACGGGPLVLSAAAASALAGLAKGALAGSSAAEIPEAALLEVERAIGAFLEQHLAHPLRADRFRRQVGPTGF